MRSKWKKKDLYIASFLKDEYDDEGNKISKYAKPEYIGKENIQPLSGESDIAEYGEKVEKMQKVLLDYDKYLGKFKEKDLAYLDRITPEGEQVNGDKANYKIDSVREQNKKIAIYFEKLPNK